MPRRLDFPNWAREGEIPLDLREDELEPLPRGLEPFHFSHRFTFTATLAPTDAIGLLSFTFSAGTDWLLSDFGIMGSNPVGAATDAADYIYIAFYVGIMRRPLQSGPINAATIRGGGHTAAARRSFGLPLDLEPSLIPGTDPLIIEVENRRAPAIGQSVFVDLRVGGVRSYAI